MAPPGSSSRPWMRCAADCTASPTCRAFHLDPAGHCILQTTGGQQEAYNSEPWAVWFREFSGLVWFLDKPSSPHNRVINLISSTLLQFLCDWNVGSFHKIFVSWKELFHKQSCVQNRPQHPAMSCLIHRIFRSWVIFRQMKFTTQENDAYFKLTLPICI